MAKIKTVILFNLGLVLALLLISVAEARFFKGVTAVAAAERTPSCDSVYGVQSGDTCFAVTQMFNLTTELFNSLNPNLVCNKIFVGQWLCVEGSV